MQARRIECGLGYIVAKPYYSTRRLPIGSFKTPRVRDQLLRCQGSNAHRVRFYVGERDCLGQVSYQLPKDLTISQSDVTKHDDLATV
jgi:hypothetical protein